MTKKEDFYIVGVGGSAGALPAFKEFLANIPSKMDAAFIVVQHLLPKSTSNLGEILSRETELPVAEVKDGVTIEPGHIYIIPPSTNLQIADHKLKLSPRTRTGLNIAIDTFFYSLARHKKVHAIGVLFSGSGTDGILGLKAIKEAGGITFAQDKSAQFPSMPRGATEAGAADYVLSPAQIAKKIVILVRDSKLQHFKTIQQKQKRQTDFLPQDKRHLESILATIQETSNVDFTYYKPGTIHRRILRRMLMNNIKDFGQYADFLKSNPKEAESLYQDLLINVTDFFRDPELFAFLKEKILPKLIKEKRSSSLRIWVPGCATGEEVYSLAMIISDLLQRNTDSPVVQIFGTDLSEESLHSARHGVYPKTIEASVPRKYLNTYFIDIDGRYQISQKIRSMCIFAKHNIIADVPFSKLDIISCRNVLIYLDSYLQKKAFPIFHYALNPGGLLILGTAETASNFQDLFLQVDREYRIYTKKPIPHALNIEFPQMSSRATVSTMSLIVDPTKKKETNIEKEADIQYIKKSATAGMIINENLTIVQFRGAIAQYLAPATGRATLDLLKMTHQSYLSKVLEMLALVKKGKAAVKKKFPAIKTEIEVIALNRDATSEKYYLIIFRSRNSKKSDVTVAAKKKTKRSEMTGALDLQRELASTIEQLQAVIEARDASNEELRSAHEELMSSNEELQSTNEELETTKEELQSTNEELMTLNAELQDRNVDLEQHSKELYRKDQFLSFLGHELRNPLSPIVHSIELARLHGIEDPEIRQYFDVIDHQASMMNDIIKNLLDAARAIGGKIELQVKPVDFDTIVKTAIDTARPYIEEAKHILEVRLLDRPQPILLDPGRVEQIITNLLNNAAKYTKPGGIITVTAGTEDGFVVLSIKDTGIGISHAMLPHIFSLFFQGEQSLNNFKGGLGVGLVLAKTLTELHGGTLTATSPGPGKGSEFILKLPINIESAPDSDDHTLKADLRDIILKKKRVLVVDDNVMLSNIFGTLLTKLNQDVTVVHTGEEAIKKARELNPEVIFIDVAMPNMSGYELIAALKESLDKKAKCIALSGFGNEYVQKSMAAGFDEHLIKPASTADLRRILS